MAIGAVGSVIGAGDPATGVVVTCVAVGTAGTVVAGTGASLLVEAAVDTGVAGTGGDPRTATEVERAPRSGPVGVSERTLALGAATVVQPTRFSR